MPTIQELLQTSNPEELQKLLDAMKMGQPIPTPGPTPPPSPISQSPMGQPPAPPISFKGPMSNPEYNLPMVTQNRAEIMPGTLGEGPFKKAEEYAPTVENAMMDNEEDNDMSDPSSSISSSSRMSSQDRISQVESEQPLNLPPSLMPSEPMGDADELRKLQEQADNQRLVANMMRGAETLTSGLMGTKYTGPTKIPGESFWKDFAEQADVPVKQFQERVAHQQDDPGSEYSKGMRSFASPIIKNIGMDPSSIEKMSAAQISKVFPQINNLYTQKMAQEARKDLAMESRSAKSEAKSEKQRERDEKFTQSLRKELTTGEIGKARTSYSTAKRAEDALSQFRKNPTGYTDYGTLMVGLKTLQGDQSVVREAEMRLGQEATSLFNKAANAIQRAATGKSLTDEQRKQIVESIDILTKTAKKQYLEMAKPVIHQAKTENTDLEKLVSKDDFPEFFESVPKMEKSKNLSKDDEDAIKWARANISDPRAKRILQLHGLK